MQQETFTVFIVDDDESVRRALLRLLKSAAIKALTFASAEDFLALTAGRIQGCLVLDIRLPGMNGLDLQEHLISQGINCKVIYMTAHDNPRWRDRAMKMGTVAFLNKPFHDQALLDAIQFGKMEHSKRGVEF